MSPPFQRVTAVHQYDIVEVKGNLLADKLMSPEVNGIKVEDLQEKVLLLNDPQELPETFVFQNVVASGNFIFFLHNIDRSLRIMFSLEIRLDGRVNNVDIEEDIARKNGQVAVCGTKTLENLVVEEDVEMCSGCFVGSYDLSDWASRAVLINGSYTLSGGRFESMTFQQPITLKEQLNGASVDKKCLLTLSDNQKVTGVITLSAQLPHDILPTSKTGLAYHNATEGFTLAGRFRNLTVEGLYNGVNLANFYERAVRFLKCLHFNCLSVFL